DRASIILQRVETQPIEYMGIPAPCPGQVNDLHIANFLYPNFPYAWRPPEERWNGDIFHLSHPVFAFPPQPLLLCTRSKSQCEKQEVNNTLRLHNTQPYTAFAK
ncbi:MAG: hypothetical protein J6S58_08900, partial [Lentisphaeria bacterium]|nr:hypothetical protein [Lentisphaeria bacterium]